MPSNHSPSFSSKISSSNIKFYHLTLIPSNKGLFKRAIAQSGVASRYGVQKRKYAEETVQGLSEKTKCPKGDSEKFIDCLRKASVESLLNDDFFSMSEDKVDAEYKIGPVVDGELFPAHPIELLEDPNSPQSIFFGSILSLSYS